MFSASVHYALIDVVAKDSSLTVQEAHKAVTKKGLSVSLPNFYKIVARMIDEQILSKREGKLRMHRLFLRNMKDIIQACAESEVAPADLQIAEGGQKVREAKSLYELHSIRSELLAQMSAGAKTQNAYHYTSHPYYLLGLPEQEKLQMEDLAGAFEKSYLLIGNESVLDRYACQLLARELYNITCASDVAFPSQGYFLDIIGDYMLECMLPKSVSDIFALIFTTVVREDGYKKEGFLQLMKMKLPCSLKVIYSAAHAKKLRLKIARQFEGKAL